CFGTLPMGPLQKNVSIADSAAMIVHALDQGVNFIDTAQLYRTYPAVRAALAATGARPVIATKSLARDYAGMQAAIDEALVALGVDCLDIVHLHAARATAAVFAERAGALQCLIDNRAQGKIRAAGISSHAVPVIRAAADHPEIDVVFPLYNCAGLGILAGTLAEMRLAIDACVAADKGVYLMKALGGGRLIDRYREAMDFCRGIPGVASLAVGTVSLAELEFNLAWFAGTLPPDATFPELAAWHKQFRVVEFLCNNCGTCRSACASRAISEQQGKANINQEQCVQCGYCVSSCPQFAIRVL
ncbi:MAG TPA: aldo/keto reductase, partial [bacterium]|nr:aldo/keto reductase [bacterium]